MQHEFDTGNIKIYVFELWASDEEQLVFHKVCDQLLPNPCAHICLVVSDDELPHGTNSLLSIKQVPFGANQNMETLLTEYLRAVAQKIREGFESTANPDVFKSFIENELDLGNFNGNDADD